MRTLRSTRPYLMALPCLFFAALLALTVLLQVFLVFVADEVTRYEYPELRYLWIPYAAAAVVTVVCLQIVLLCIFILVQRAQRMRLYQLSTLRIVDTATGTLILAGVIPVVVIQHLNWTENANPPLLTLFCLVLIVLTPATFGVMRVLRQVYLKAAQDQEELEGVI